MFKQVCACLVWIAYVKLVQGGLIRYLDNGLPLNGAIDMSFEPIRLPTPTMGPETPIFVMPAYDEPTVTVHSFVPTRFSGYLWRLPSSMSYPISPIIPHVLETDNEDDQSETDQDNLIITPSVDSDDTADDGDDTDEEDASFSPFTVAMGDIDLDSQNKNNESYEIEEMSHIKTPIR